ncbi:hypothetical protein HPB49_006808 [Dermacentor silvarum]|uniref:Uncharacterized protein n=1 Tax=Dermacentor silvarum TaxID=543639 RepID=A0ACB8CQ66_DERSI|nr:hypothetical protein HPB49_006808 [Dermacentor silvarum]
MVDEFCRLESHRLHTVTQRYLAALKEQGLSRMCEGGSREFTLALLNLRSLSAHALGVARDPVLGKVDLLCLTETWNNGTAAGSGCEDAVVRGYDAAACARAVATRRAGGVDVFLKRYLPFSEELRQQRQSSLLVLDSRVCPSVASKRSLPPEWQQDIITHPLPRNMHPVHHENRRTARAKAYDKYSDHAGAFFVDAAGPLHNRSTATVVHRGQVVDCISATGMDIKAMEEAGIALAMRNPRATFVLTDSQTAYRNFARGQVGTLAHTILQQAAANRQEDPTPPPAE